MTWNSWLRPRTRRISNQQNSFSDDGHNAWTPSPRKSLLLSQEAFYSAGIVTQQCHVDPDALVGVAEQSSAGFVSGYDFSDVIPLQIRRASRPHLVRRTCGQLET